MKVLVAEGGLLLAHMAQKPVEHLIDGAVVRGRWCSVCSLLKVLVAEGGLLLAHMAQKPVEHLIHGAVVRGRWCEVQCEVC